MREAAGTSLMIRRALTWRNSRPAYSPVPTWRPRSSSRSKRASWGALSSSANRQRSLLSALTSVAIGTVYTNVCSLHLRGLDDLVVHGVHGLGSAEHEHTAGHGDDAGQLQHRRHFPRPDALAESQGADRDADDRIDHR